MLIYIIYGLPVLVAGYFLVTFIFDLLLRGFVPFIPSRPWVVEQILYEMDINKPEPIMVALSSGRSGFFHALEKKYPNARLIGVETDLFPFIVSKVQSWIRRTRIKVIKSSIHHVDVKKADFIYSHLYPDKMQGLSAKFKFECRPGTVIVSTGFNIPYLEPKKVVDLPDRKGRLDFLSKNQNLFQRKSRLFKKEKKAYFYEI